MCLKALLGLSLAFFAALLLQGTATAHDRAASPLPQPPVLARAGEAAVDVPGTQTCALTLALLDASSGEALSGLVHIVNATGETVRIAELLSRTTALSKGSLGDASFAYMDRWSVLPAPRTIQVPQEALTVTAFSGLTTRQSQVSVDLTGKAAADLAIPLEALGNAGGAQGNVHLHLQKMTLHEAERYGTEIAMADGLDLVFFSYLERAGADEYYISNTFTPADLQRFSARSGVVFGYGEEYRHNFPGAEGYGHVMFLDLPKLILPASMGPNITKQGNDDGILRPGIEAARTQQATVLWCHNTRGLEDIPSWIAGLLDGQIIFDGGATGDYETGIYRYLNVGLRVPVSMGTDWFCNDMAVTVVPVKGTLTTASWLAALRAGRSYITNGPLLDFTVNDAGMGETRSLEHPETVRVHARGIARNDFHVLEVVANGTVAVRAETHAVEGGFEAVVDTELPIPRSAWFATRAVPFEGSYDTPESVQAGFNEYGKPLFAHSSPIYVEIGGAPIFVRAAAESLIAELRSSMVTIRHTGVYTDDTQRDTVLALYDAAKATLERQLNR